LNTRRKCYSLSQLVHISQDINTSKFQNHGHCITRSPEVRQILLSSKTCLPSSYCYITCHFSKFAHVYTEDEDNVFLQNVGTHLPQWMVPWFWEPQFIPLWNTKNFFFTGTCIHSHKTLPYKKGCAWVKYDGMWKYLIDKINALATHSRNKNIRDLNRGINEFRMWQQPKT
jgi:hypothetical protein